MVLDWFAFRVQQVTKAIKKRLTNHSSGRLTATSDFKRYSENKIRMCFVDEDRVLPSCKRKGKIV